MGGYIVLGLLAVGAGLVAWTYLQEEHIPKRRWQRATPEERRQYALAKRRRAMQAYGVTSEAELHDYYRRHLGEDYDRASIYNSNRRRTKRRRTAWA